MITHNEVHHVSFRGWGVNGSLLCSTFILVHSHLESSLELTSPPKMIVLFEEESI